MMEAAQQGMASEGIKISTEQGRNRIISRCSLYGALGWVLAEIAYELLFGPHIRLLRTLAIGSGIGAVVGLLTSSLQWTVLRDHVKSAGWWIVVTTGGYTLSGILSGFFLYQAIKQTDLFLSTLPLQGIISSSVTGLVVGAMQWPVLRSWIGPGLRWNSWIAPVTVGTALAAPAAYLAGGAMIALLTWAFGHGAWPIIIAAGYLAAGVTGSIIFRRFLALAFHRVLPTPGSALFEAEGRG